MILHGAPGGLNTFLSYGLHSELLENFQLMVVERLGYGDSVIEGQKKHLSVSEHADAIGQIIEKKEDIHLL